MATFEIDVFKKNCETASNMLIMWEKANWSDRERCLKDFENLPTPLGLEQEWEFVKAVWTSFYYRRRVDVSSLSCPFSLKNLDRQVIFSRSDDARNYISDICDYICVDEDDADSYSTNEEESETQQSAFKPCSEISFPVFEKYFNFFEGFAREEDGDDSNIQVYANFLADRFGQPEQRIFSRFKFEEISNQTSVYGSVNAVETSESDVYDIWDCFITAKSIIIRHYHTDDEERNDDYYVHLNWEDIYSVGRDSEYKYCIDFYDIDGEEIGFVLIGRLCGRDDNKTVAKWLKIFTEVVCTVHQDEENDSIADVAESLNDWEAESKSQDETKNRKSVSFL